MSQSSGRSGSSKICNRDGRVDGTLDIEQPFPHRLISATILSGRYLKKKPEGKCEGTILKSVNSS